MDDNAAAHGDRRKVARATAGAALLAPIGVVVACLCIPPGVDEYPTSDAKMARTLARVAEHPFATRLGFLAFAVGMLLLIPAMAVVRQLVGRQRRGRGSVEVGTRLVAVAAGAIAIGNSFAPASEPSAIRTTLPREVMVDYMRHHLTNGWDLAILAVYPLLPIGAVVLGVGLWRGRVVSRPATLFLVVPLVLLLAPPLSPPAVVLGLGLEVGVVLLLRDASRPALA